MVNNYIEHIFMGLLVIFLMFSVKKCLLKSLVHTINYLDYSRFGILLEIKKSDTSSLFFLKSNLAVRGSKWIEELFVFLFQ